MIQIPKSAGLLARLAAKEAGRLSLAGVQVIANGTEARLVATDGHALGIIRGPVIPPGLEACVLVPAREWAEAFRACAKDGHVELHEQTLTTVGKSQTVVPFVPVAGRFPDYMRVLPTLAPAWLASVNPRLLIRVLEVAAAIAETQDDALPRVMLFGYTPSLPLGVASVGKDFMTFDGLVMPLN